MRASNVIPIWERKRPKRLGPSVPLTAAQKRKAKALAAAAGRSYPNLVDNIAASRNPMKPKLKPHEGSYAVVSLETGKAVAELAKDSKLLDKINTDKYRLVPIAEYLAGLNRKVNPMKKPTPAQLAARARFAEMARSGAFKRKAKRNPAPVKMKIRGSETPDNPDGIIVTEAGALRFAKQNMPADLKRAGFVPSVVAGARGWSINYGAPVPGHSSYSRNPRKKTVSQKISQLVHEGYPQKQAVAVALSEQRKGKVKRNPATGHKGSRTKLNPMAAPVQVSSDSMFKYAVEAKRSLGSAGAVFETVAAFRTKAQAQDYAKAILASHPSATLRIKTYSRQK